MVHRALTVLQNQKYYLTIDYMWKEATPIINLFKQTMLEERRQEIYTYSVDNNNGWLTVADNALDRKSQLSVTYTLRYNGKTLSNTKVMYTNVHSFMVYFTANTFESFTIDSVSPTEDNDYIYVIGTP